MQAFRYIVTRRKKSRSADEIGTSCNSMRRFAIGCDVAESRIYVVFPDEGHGFYKPQNNIAFHAIVEAFLARHLGGRAEPIARDFEGSSHQIRAGADIIEELAVG